MKSKIILSLVASLLFCGNAFADELVVKDITIPQGGTAELTVGFSSDGSTTYAGFSFNHTFADGISVTNRSLSVDNFSITAANENGVVVGPSSLDAAFSGTEGDLIVLTLSADATTNIGDVIPCSLSNIVLTKKDASGSLSSVNFDDVSFNITISRWILDETSTTAPEATTDPVNVKVKRTIKANQWSTICLPFAMATEQVTEAFGSGVQLADFTGVVAELDAAEENTVGMTFNFNTVTSIEENHPYLIKVANNISEFNVDGVTINPDEAIVKCDENRIKMSGKWYTFYNSFYGTYVADTQLDVMSLFLSGNQMWYSAGLTKIKAFRGYFVCDNAYLTEVSDQLSSVKLNYVIDGTTRINGLNADKTNDAVYDLSGRRIEKPQQRGVYIVNGKKVAK